MTLEAYAGRRRRNRLKRHFRIAFDGAVAAGINRAARRRGVEPEVLVHSILRTITLDNLFDAVLDDAAERGAK